MQCESEDAAGEMEQCQKMQRYREMEQCQKMQRHREMEQYQKKGKWTATQNCFTIVLQSPLDEMLRHNREMKKVRSFIRKRVVKNEFEALYLKHFEAIVWKACAITAAMEQSGCMQIYEKNVAENRMMHGDYNYHNILILPGDTAITNFEHMRIGIQVQDVLFFLRKAMEKYRWKQKLGVGIIRAYERQRRLEPGEWEYLGLQLAYPEKFWKTASSYCRSNKAWLPEKSVEKLELAVNQEEEKTNFLKTIFGIQI